MSGGGSPCPAALVTAAISRAPKPLADEAVRLIVASDHTREQADSGAARDA